MASTISAFPANSIKTGEIRQKEANLSQTSCNTLSNGSIAAAHPEIYKIKGRQDNLNADLQGYVQINFNNENIRLSERNNMDQVSGQTRITDDFSNKTDNVDNDFIKDTHNGGISGRYVCPYCKLSCAKPSVLQKHIRAHTNERPYPCVPCGFAFKTKSNLYKHRRSRTHALRLQGTDVSTAINEDDISGGSESDSSLPATSISDAGSDPPITRIDNLRPSEFSSPELLPDRFTPPSSSSSTLNDNSKSKTIYKPKFRAAFYQENDKEDKIKKTISQNAHFLTEHISKIISDNEAIVDVIETPLQKKYGKIKQIAESKQLMNENLEVKSDPTPLNLTKSSTDGENSFRKRSHSESFSQADYHKHPLNPEGSIIKDLLLKTKSNGLVLTGELDGSLFICPLCQITYRSSDNLEIHRLYYCKGSINSNSTLTNDIQNDTQSAKREIMYARSNSINVRLPETSTVFQRINTPPKTPPIRSKPDNLVIIKPESNDVIAPLPSPGPLLGNTRLVDSRTSDFARKSDSLKIKSNASPKRKIESSSDTFSPRLIENMSPRSNDLFQTKIRCIDVNPANLRSMEEISQHMRHNSTSLQMFGGEVKIVDHSGGTTTLRIEPSKNQLSPIIIQHNLSPSKLGNDVEASSVVVRSGLHSGGTIVQNPPTPKEVISTPQTPRIPLSSGSGPINSNISGIHDITHFQFPPFNAITAYNPLTLPPLSPSSSPSGATTILHGGKLIPHVPGIPGPNTPGIFIGNRPSQMKTVTSDIHKNAVEKTHDGVHGNSIAVNVQATRTITPSKFDTNKTRSPNFKFFHGENERNASLNTEVAQCVNSIPIIRVKNVDEPNTVVKPLAMPIKPILARQDGAVKRNAEGLPKTPGINSSYVSNKSKSVEKNNYNVKILELNSDTDMTSFNFENLITKAEIYNNQIPSSSEVQKNTNAQDITSSIQNERSETLYFQKSITTRPILEDRKPKFLRPSTLPLKPGTFTPKRHHGITPNANTMPLVSPETPRPAKAYGQLYLNGNAYTYLGLKCSTKVFYCTINRPQPTYVPNQHFLSMYSNWQLLSELTPDPLGLSASSAMSLYDSRHRPQNVAAAVIKQDLILTHSSKWNKNSKDNKQIIQTLDNRKFEENKFSVSENAVTPKKELTGGFESNEEYTYVRGRGRGRYVCSECGIRCKKPSMLKKHIRTHTDVRPFTCVHCSFSFKTKGNLTKHMKSKAHYKKCCELGINPNEGNELECSEMAQCSGETDDDTESEGDEGNEGETESSDTEICKSRLPEHEAAHCLLSLGSSRPVTSATPGLITTARPSTYPYNPIGMDISQVEFDPERHQISLSTVIDSRKDVENEPIDLRKSEIKTTSNIPEIPTARESSVLASLASNTAKLPKHQNQLPNGEPMLHTYLTERALLDSRIKQSQFTANLTKSKKVELEKNLFAGNGNITNTHNVIIENIGNNVVEQSHGPKLANTNDSDIRIKSPLVNKDDEMKMTNIVATNHEPKRSHSPNNSNAENAKYVVSEYLKHARINLIKSREDSPQKQTCNSNEVDNIQVTTEEVIKADDINASECSETANLTTALDHDPIARKVVIGAGGVAFKVTKGKEYENTQSYSPGRLMEDGRRVCDFCNKTFTKPSQLRLHLNIHYMERPFRCSACAVSFRTRGHLQKHERSGSHHNKVSMTSTFGAATSLNPRPFRCSDCNIAFRIHGHLAKHLRSKMHVMRLECLFKLPFGTFTEIERAGVSLTDIDTTDCASSLASLQSLARKLHEKDPTKLEYREPSGGGVHSSLTGRESPDEEDIIDNACDSDRDCEMKSVVNSEGQEIETQVKFSATDI